MNTIHDLFFLLMILNRNKFNVNLQSDIIINF